MKRPIDTVRAFAAAAGPGGQLLVVGMDGDQCRGEVLAAIPDGARQRVHVIGELQGRALGNAMMASDAFISLSRRENFGYALCDALVHGLPIIVTPGHDIIEELPKGPKSQLACGWRLDDDEFASAAAAIANLYACSAAQLADMGSVGRAWATAHLSSRLFRNSLMALMTVAGESST